MPPRRPAARASRVVYKFGGAALADSDSIRRIAQLVSERRPQSLVVVVSAMAGVTDELLALTAAAPNPAMEPEPQHRRLALLERMRQRHTTAAASLSLERTTESALVTVIDRAFESLRALVLPGGAPLGLAAADEVLAQGERLSAQLVSAAFVAAGVNAEFVDAQRVMRTDDVHGNASPDIERTIAAARDVLDPLLAHGVVPVVPGFTGSAPDGSVTTLGRGGSDLTATVLSRVIGAAEVVLWKDVVGMLTADPAIVADARLIPSLHVREAAELAYYGARVLHPRALTALAQQTRLLIRPFSNPEMPGTEISFRPPDRSSKRYPVKALAALGTQALVTITGNGMAGVPGIAARAFGALERERLSVSLISQASSEHSICVGIPAGSAPRAARALGIAFERELARGEIDGVEVRENVASLAIVGLGMAGRPGIAAKLFTALADAGINVIAIAQGASELNITFVVDANDAAAAQRAIHSAFRLDKIGGGIAERTSHADVVILGFGQVGRALATGLAALPSWRGVRVVAVLDRSGYVFDARGFAAKRLEQLAAAKSAGKALADQQRGKRAPAADALGFIGQHALSRPILVDVTADDTGALLEAAVAAGMDLVLANKRPLAAQRRSADSLAASAAARGRRVLHEATVGAGLPIIDTINKLIESGDRILKIEGCPSGTLGYLFGELERGVPFSSALRAAMKLGYTEPDPRDDLSGMDVARKAIILGRLVGFTGELDDVDVESLVPSELRSIPLLDFLGKLETLDAPWAERVAAAQAQGSVLRYRATITSRHLRVGVVAVPVTNSFAALTGTDNQFVFTTNRYRTNPLVIRGPGAGIQVTAAGIVNDVLKLAVMR